MTEKIVKLNKEGRLKEKEGEGGKVRGGGGGGGGGRMEVSGGRRVYDQGN